MKQFFIGLFFLSCASLGHAQSWECGYVDLGKGILEQPLLLNRTESAFSYQAVDSVNTSIFEMIQNAIPPYDEILDIEFGATTFIYTMDGGAIVFRKCKASATNKTASTGTGGLSE
ncbi:MAG: hypothetical protein KDD36_13705 [Flavobacteriales bacterium]|nr:hypothetical protein [Flavobacteriales bacterium]